MERSHSIHPWCFGSSDPICCNTPLQIYSFRSVFVYACEKERECPPSPSQVLLLLYCMKLQFPNAVFLNRRPVQTELGKRWYLKHE